MGRGAYRTGPEGFTSSSYPRYDLDEKHRKFRYLNGNPQSPLHISRRPGPLGDGEEKRLTAGRHP
jgi:hypothetical protein